MTLQFFKNHGTVCRLTEQVQQQQVQLASLQLRFMNIGNVTMVTVGVENSQNQRAVDLHRCMKCEMQIHFVQNVHVALHSYIYGSNKVCISISVHTVCVLHTVGIHKRAHIALWSGQHTVQSHFTFRILLQTDRHCEGHTSNSDSVKVQNLKSCLNCAQLCNLPFQICVYIVLYLLCCVFVLFRLCMFIVICFVCTSLRITATG